MAKVVITIEDQSGKNNLSIELTSTPEWNVKNEDSTTPAQMAGFSFLNWLAAEKDAQSAQSSERGKEWQRFASEVFKHIEQYTIPQFGDKPNDQLHTEWTIDDCMLAIKKYANRAGKNSRGPGEDIRDLLKIAHYACVAWHKRQGL